MKNDLIYLDDASQFISDVSRKIQHISKDAFMSDENLQDSVTLKIIHIGEAFSRISEIFKQQYPDFPWHEASGMRNRLAHDYGRINLDDVWTTATIDLPELAKLIQDIESASAKNSP